MEVYQSHYPLICKTKMLSNSVLDSSTEYIEVRRNVIQYILSDIARFYG